MPATNHTQSEALLTHLCGKTRLRGEAVSPLRFNRWRRIRASESRACENMGQLRGVVGTNRRPIISPASDKLVGGLLLCQRPILGGGPARGAGLPGALTPDRPH